jgi:uncharacterized membrane protein YoaK (UPF0700 family)
MKKYMIRLILCSFVISPAYSMAPGGNSSDLLSLLILFFIISVLSIIVGVIIGTIIGNKLPVKINLIIVIIAVIISIFSGFKLDDNLFSLPLFIFTAAMGISIAYYILKKIKINMDKNND